MRIAVCAKQVPYRNEGGMNSETGLINRGQLKSVINTYDLVAMEMALRIKELVDDSAVDVFTMAPERGVEVIYHAYSIGFDHGYLLCDNKFSAADVLATSYTLASGIKNIDGYDLIVCGKQTTDGDTGQVASGIACWLGVPYISNVSEIVRIDKKTAVFKQILDHKEYEIKVKLPCTISVLKDICIPRTPTLTLKLKSKKKEYTILNSHNMDNCDIEKTGSKGSPTRVAKIYPSPATKKQDLIKKDYKAASTLILDLIKENGNVE
jgi:electron transfer flavoprotein beta subunit